MFKVVYESELELNESGVSSWVPKLRIVSHDIDLTLYPLLGLHRVYFLYSVKINVIPARLYFYVTSILANTSERTWALLLAVAFVRLSV